MRDGEATSLEANAVVEQWATTLDTIEREPETLVGTIDWITKRALLERAAATAAERKKIDLKYHELGTGYFARLEAHGLSPELVGDDEIRAAQTRPPADTPARLRAHLMRDLAGVPKVNVGWDRVRVGGRLRGRVIPLHGPDRPS